MKIIVRTNVIKEVELKEDEEEIPFDNEKFNADQKSLSPVYEKQQTQQMKFRNEMLEQAIIDFWESIE